MHFSAVRTNCGHRRNRNGSSIAKSHITASGSGYTASPTVSFSNTSYATLYVNTPTAAVTLSSNLAFIAGSSELYLGSTGNIGIGTTSPFSTLSVSGNGYLSGGLGVGLLNTTAGTFQTSGIETIGGLSTLQSGFVSQASSTIEGNFTSTGNGIFGGTLALNSTTGTSTVASGQGFTVGGSQFVVQQSSGNVGIGTASPTAPLQVSFDGGSSNAGPTASFGTGASANSYVFFGGGRGIIGYETAYSGGGTSGSLSLSAGTNKGLQMFTGGTNGSFLSGVNALDITPSGNIGIGTTSPAALLSVAGSEYLTGSVGIGTSSPASALDIEANNSQATVPQLTMGQSGTGDAIEQFLITSGCWRKRSWNSALLIAPATRRLGGH